MDSIFKDPLGKPLTDEEIEQMEEDYQYDKVTGFFFAHDPDQFAWQRMNIPRYRGQK